MPKILTDDDIADFRAELCRVATERFAKHGYDGVTMRQLADVLGCSPKTPYRYFKDKADILATVRAAAYGRFADVLEAAAASSTDPAERSRRVGRSYIEFALANPAAYRIMFDLNVPEAMNHPELRREAARARQFITRQAEDLARAGLIVADPQIVGWAMWAGVHGLVVLKLAGLMREGPDFDVLHHNMMRLIFDGARVRPSAAAMPATGRAKR
ncbi:TetR/AcrR family transcriptional regulator [Vineibacter terrae]|uniref:TetR/AcrR family transcriptional regulator n=1 Tax=Vineibacter terrae TaxID=2586908 RepID=A0A5C8PM47_9HYPH|nr:TetR/AcrR family transcriptional regulator [Vineibacter terrae]TXL74584.1 TetR/AcrR family transcriptional regulator [Vineibacter terrae]